MLKKDKPKLRKGPIKFPGGVAPPTLTEQEQADKEAGEAFKRSLTNAAKSKTHRDLEERGREMAQIEAVADACENIPNPPTFYRPRKHTVKKPVVRPVLLLSDWHIGDTVRADETEGFGSFDIATAQERVTTLVTNFLNHVERQRTLYEIEDIDVFVIGDMVSGDIHDELLVHNEVSAPEQAVISGKMLAGALADIGRGCRRVNIAFCGADNHSRLQRRPISKHKAINSWSYVVGEVMRATLPMTPGKFDVTVFKGVEQVVQVLDTRFLVTHGDAIKSWMGIPWYGVQKRLGNEALLRQGTDKTFDVFVMGHYHTPISTPHLIVNGSLSGTTEFDHSCGRHCGPCQVSFMVSKNHGVFSQITWWL